MASGAAAMQLVGNELKREIERRTLKLKQARVPLSSRSKLIVVLPDASDDWG